MDLVASQYLEVSSTFSSFLVGPPTQVQLSPSSWRPSPHKEITGGPHPTGQSPVVTCSPHRWTPNFTCGNSSKPVQDSSRPQALTASQETLTLRV